MTSREFVYKSIVKSLNLVIVLGDSSVGKTNLIARFCYNETDAKDSILDHFKPSNVPTVAIEFCSQDVKISRDDKSITGKIWV